MTIGAVMVGLMVAMALVQLPIFWSWRLAGKVQTGTFWLMALGAAVPPLVAYLALYFIWPELGALEIET